MPGRDYTRAHALLQESLAGDASYPSLHLIHNHTSHSLPSTGTRGRNAQPIANRPPDQKSEAFDGQRSTHLLPPTSPNNSIDLDDIDPSFGLSKPLQSSEQSSSTRPSTPFNLGTSVTSDTQPTPPSLGGHGEPIGESKSPSALNYRSSHAESFITAQEEQGSRSSLSGSRPFLPIHGDLEGSRSSPLHSVAVARASRSLQNSISPNLGGNATAASPPFSGYVQGSGRISSQATGTRRRRFNGTQPIPNERSFLDDGLESDPGPVSEDSPHSWFEASSSDGHPSLEDMKHPRTPDRPGSNDKEADFLNMTPPKRLPSSTKAPAIIEADIRESPESTPRREHRLRHYHKFDALRDGQTDSDRHTPTLSNVDESPIINLRKLSVLHDEDVRARTRSSLVASLPVGLKATSPLWRRTKSLSAAKTSRANTTGSHAQQISDPLSDVLGDRLDRGAIPPDQLYGLSDGNECFTAFAPSELHHLHRRQSSGHLTADGALDRHSAVFSARHTLTQPSPFSEVSEGLILNDARAISIVPHNNESLLVVHQQRSANNSVRISSARSVPVAVPRTRDDRGQRHNEAYTVERSQGSKMPNIARVIGPTANDETGAANQNPVETRPELARQDSMMKRAIRSLSTPRGSLLRRHTTRSGGSQSQESHVRESSRRRLHPFWQPRGFWEDFSDTGDVLHKHASRTRTLAHENQPEDAARSSPRRGDIQRTRSLRHIFTGERNTLHQAHSQLQASSSPGSFTEERRVGLGFERKQGLSWPALQRLASLKATVKSMGAARAERSNSQHRRLRLGLKEKIEERTKRRQEQRREQERTRIRESIGPRFYVDTIGDSDD